MDATIGGCARVRGRRSAAHVVVFLQNSEPTVRTPAVEALGRMGPEGPCFAEEIAGVD